MNDETIDTTIRRFLDEFGVSGHKAVSAAITAAVADGRVFEGQELAVTATLTVDGVGLSHIADGILNTKLN